MSTRRAITSTKKANQYPASVLSYSVGFALSIGLTLLAYWVVVADTFSMQTVVLIIMGLAALQLVTQLMFFLHLGRESKPRWNITAFAFMLITLLIVVVGSLWIMNNLNYNMMMSPEEMNNYMLEQNRKGF